MTPADGNEPMDLFQTIPHPEPSQALPGRSLCILVVGDTPANPRVLTTLLAKQGHETVTACDGFDTIHVFLRESPDLILMDVMMPNMDSIKAVRHIRDISEIVPIVFLAAAGDESLVAQGLEIGSDYIAKPVDLPQLDGKLAAHFRTVLAYREALAQRRAAQELLAGLVAENRGATQVPSRMLAHMLAPGDNLQYTTVSSCIFSGDIVLAGKTPSGRLNVLLADAVGHGLPGAFLLMPIIPAFDAMTRKGFPLKAIMFEMNRKLTNVMPVGRFVAATAVSINPGSSHCEVWVGGNPAALAVSGGGLRRVASSHPALGLANGEDKGEFVGETLRLERGDRLVFASGSLIEVWHRHIAPNVGAFDNFVRTCPPDAVFAHVMDLVERHGRHNDNDTSLAVLRMGEPAAVAASQPPSRARQHASVDLKLDVPQLRKPPLLRDIADIARRLALVDTADARFDLVLTELFANSLDHGVLGLSSEVKYAGDGGLDHYLFLREEKLAALDHGHIRVEIEASEFSGQPAKRLQSRHESLPEDFLRRRRQRRNGLYPHALTQHRETPSWKSVLRPPTRISRSALQAGSTFHRTRSFAGPSARRWPPHRGRSSSISR